MDQGGRVGTAGLIGCGAIALHHARALSTIGVDLVAVCDPRRERAEALARATGARVVANVEEAVAAGASVIHVTTPPEAHADAVRRALSCGAHVFVEKPFTMDVGEAVELVELARRIDRRLGVDHSLLFDPQIIRVRERVRAGGVGRVTGLEILRASTYPSDIPPAQLQRAGDPFRDLGSHALYLAMEFLGPIEDVASVHESRGGDPRLAYDEWTALVRCRSGVAQVRLSWNERPQRSELVVHGTRGGIRVDLLAMAASPRRHWGWPAPVERAIGVVLESAAPVADLARGTAGVLSGRVQPYQGVRGAIAAFHEAVRKGGRSPVEPELAVEVVRWCEHVARRAEEDHRRASHGGEDEPASYLVTGASGAIGGAVVRRLLGRGERVRCLVRRTDADLPIGAVRVVGCLEDADAVQRAVRGVHTVIHAGAAMAGDWVTHERGTVMGTRHVIDACAGEGARLVHISSLSVLALGLGTQFPVSEDFPLEPRPELRGHYSRAKLLAEEAVTDAVRSGRLRAVVVRPGIVFGGRLPLVTRSVASRLGERWLVLGDGRQHLPLVYLEDVVDGIVLAADSELHHGEVIHLVEEDAPTQNEVLERALGETTTPVRLPASMVLAMAAVGQSLFGAMGQASPVSTHRLRAAMTSHAFTAARARALLGWHPRIGVRTGIERSVGP